MHKVKCFGARKKHILKYIYIYESKRFVTAKYQIKFLFHSQIKVIITWTSSAFRLARERGQLSNIQASLSNRHYVNEVKLTQNVNSSHYHQQQKKKKKKVLPLSHSKAWDRVSSLPQLLPSGQSCKCLTSRAFTFLLYPKCPSPSLP